MKFFFQRSHKILLATALAVMCLGSANVGFCGVLTELMYAYHGNRPPELKAYLVTQADLPGVWSANSTVPSYGSDIKFKSGWYLVVAAKNQNARGMFWGKVRCWVPGYQPWVDVPITGLSPNMHSWQTSVIALGDSIIHLPDPNSIKVEWVEINAAAL